MSYEMSDSTKKEQIQGFHIFPNREQCYNCLHLSCEVLFDL